MIYGCPQASGFNGRLDTGDSDFPVTMTLSCSGALHHPMVAHGASNNKEPHHRQLIPNHQQLSCRPRTSLQNYAATAQQMLATHIMLITFVVVWWSPCFLLLVFWSFTVVGSCGPPYRSSRALTADVQQFNVIEGFGQFKKIKVLFEGVRSHWK